MLPVLGGRFDCHAVVRNPLAVLASVQSVNPDLSSTKNVAPGAQMLDEDFARDLSEMPHDPLGWLLRLLSWSFERYARFLSPENVIRYEDIVASGGRALSGIIPAAGELDEPLENKNLNEFYVRMRHAEPASGCSVPRGLTGVFTPAKRWRTS